MFFQGVPSTAAGALLMLPLIIELSDINIRNINSSPYIIIYTIIIGILSVSTIPTFSIKKIYILKKYLSLTMVGLGCATILLISYPWITIPIILICYLLSMPICIYKYNQYQKSIENHI